MSHEIEDSMEAILARMEGELSSPDTSEHLEACAETLRELQLNTLRMVTAAQEQVKLMMADAPEEDFRRVVLPLLRLTFAIASWDNYVERLIDNSFNFAETPYRPMSEAQFKLQQYWEMPADFAVQPPSARHSSRPH